ncbi:MAG: hypothetical protein F2562_09990, partial [Actinobacteria bacterium]|nr:hypothetical protein [Actinomycetota bacterium]
MFVSMRWFIQRHNHKGQKVDITKFSRQRLSAPTHDASDDRGNTASTVVRDRDDNRNPSDITRVRRASASLAALAVIASVITFAPTSVLALSDVDANSGTTAVTNEEVKDLLPDSPSTKRDDSPDETGDPQYITPTITRTPSTGTPLITSSTELPAAVGELRVTPGDGRLDINWVAPDPGQGGRAAATSYRVRFSTDASSWTALPSTIVTSASIDGLANGSVVYVDVAAVNIAGTGPATSTSGVPAASASAPRGPGQQGPSTAGATVTAAITADAPVAYWPMTDPNSATSATSLAGGGALSGGVSLGFSGPIAGSSAAYVAGVAMPTTAEVNETFTFSAMIDPAVAGGDNAVLVSAGDHANGFEFRLGDRGALQFVGHRDGRATMVATASGAIAQGSWQHVAVVV